MHLVGPARGLERLFVGGGAFVDARIVLGVVDQQWGLDARDLLRPRLAAVEGHRSGQLGIGDGGRVGHAAAIAEAGDADLAGAEFMAHQGFHGGEEVVHQLFGVDLLLQLAPLVVVAGIAAHGRQAIRRQGQVASLGQTPRHVFDIGIEAAVLVHHHHGRYLAAGLGRAHQVAAHSAMALGRGVVDVFGDDIRIGEFHLAGQGIVGAQCSQHPGGRQPQHRGAGPGAVEEVAPADATVDIEVIEFEQFGREILGGETDHRGAPLAGNGALDPAG